MINLMQNVLNKTGASFVIASVLFSGFPVAQVFATPTDFDNDGIPNNLECSFTSPLQNGGLEGTASYTNPPTSWIAMYNGGAQSTDGYVATLGSTAPGSSANGYRAIPAEGSTAIFAKYDSNPGAGGKGGGVKQTINGLTVGETYTVSFKKAVIRVKQYPATSGNPIGNRFFAKEGYWKVNVDTSTPTTANVAVAGAVGLNNAAKNWSLGSITFTATNSSHTIEFLAGKDYNPTAHPTNPNANKVRNRVGLGLDDVVMFSASCDIDGDGIANQLDTDSDGDGCPDALEANSAIQYNQLDLNFGIQAAHHQPVSNTGTSQDNTQQAVECSIDNPASSLFLDSDGDKVPNYKDLDNDNDGITDTDEIKYCNATTPINGSWPVKAVKNSTDPIGTHPVPASASDGPNAKQLLFFDWTGVTVDASTTFPITKTVVHNGVTYTAQITQADVSKATFTQNLQGTRLWQDNGGASGPGWTWVRPLTDMLYHYSIGGKNGTFSEVLQLTANGVTKYQFKVSATKGGVSYPVEAVVFDGETISNTNGGEQQKITTSGSPFAELEKFGNTSTAYGPTTVDGLNTRTLTIENVDTNDDANAFAGLWTTVGKDVLINYEILPNGTSGIGLAVHVPCDLDKDGIPNYLDLDSDNDGCFDALEGGGNVTTSYLNPDGSIISRMVLFGGTISLVNANGVPTHPLSATAQTVGASQEAGKVTITTPPANQTVNAGANASFTVGASAEKTITFSGAGTPDYTSGSSDTITYKWEVSTNSGSTWAEVAGQTTATLSLSNVTTSMNGNQYRAVMTCTANTCEELSSAATLNVTAVSNFTLTYNANTGAGTMTDETKAAGSTSNLTANTFTKAGYTFAGWNTQANGSGTSYANSASFTMPNTNTTLYAQWTANTNTAYKVEHYRQNTDNSWPTTASQTDNNTGTTDSTVNAGSATFTGYTYDSSNTNNVQSGTVAGDGSLVLKRYYTINKYTLTFEENGGSAVTNQTNIPYNTTATQPTNPTKSGYTFGGWFTDNTTFANQFDFTATQITSNTTVYAKWIPATNTVYKVEHYRQNTDNSWPTTASLSQTLSGTTGSSVTAVQQTFTGYTYQSSNTNNITSGTVLANGSLVLKLYYTINKYTLAFEENGGSAVTDQTNIPYNTTATQPTNPIKSGYVFAGWYKEAGLTNAFDFTTDTITEDTTIYAKWNSNSNPVINANNKTINKGETLNLLTLVTSSTDQEDGTITSSVTIANDGGFDNNTAGTYTVTFTVTDSDGNTTTKSVTVTVNEPSSSSSSSSSSSITYTCKDKKATNYNKFGRHKQSLCKYDNTQTNTETESENKMCKEVIQKQCPIFTQRMTLGDQDGYKGKEKQESGIPTTIYQVSILQKHLKEQGFYKGSINGKYNTETFNAVKNWQTKHFNQVLKPWNLKKPTGRFYQSSERWMNILLGCNDAVTLDNGTHLSEVNESIILPYAQTECEEEIVKQCPIFTQHMTKGDKDGKVGKEKQEVGISSVINEVKLLQQTLKNQSIYQGPVDGIYGEQTEQAVKTWQTKHYNEVLKPWNLSKPTGRFYQSSERWMNELLGCEDEVKLDNGVTLGK